MRHEKERVSSISPQFPFLREFPQRYLKANGVLDAPCLRECQAILQHEE